MNRFLEGGYTDSKQIAIEITIAVAVRPVADKKIPT